MVETGWATTATMISEGIPQFFFSVETGWATTATLISEGIVWESSRNGWNWFSNHCNPDFRRYTPIFFLVDPRMLGQALQTDNSKRITSLNTQSWFIYQSNLHFYRCILILFLEMDIHSKPLQPFSKLPKITLLTIYQLSTDHLWSISNWISTLPGLWVVIIRIKVNSVRLD